LTYIEWPSEIPEVVVSYDGKTATDACIDHVASFSATNALNKDLYYNWEITLDPDNEAFNTEFEAWKETEGDWTTIDTYTVNKMYLVPDSSISIAITAKNWLDSEDSISIEVPLSDNIAVYEVFFIDQVTNEELTTTEIFSAEEFTLLLEINPNCGVDITNWENTWTVTPENNVSTVFKDAYLNKPFSRSNKITIPANSLEPDIEFEFTATLN